MHRLLVLRVASLQRTLAVTMALLFDWECRVKLRFVVDVAIESFRWLRQANPALSRHDDRVLFESLYFLRLDELKTRVRPVWRYYQLLL